MATYKQPKKTQSAQAGMQSPAATARKQQVTVGNMRSSDYAPTKTSGIKIRGTGAAKKGVMARGPMA